MKRKLIISCCVLSLGLGSITSGAASSGNDGGAMIADMLIARPTCLAATIIGTAFFIVSVPFLAPAGSVSRAADALVVTPAKATFSRRLGDFDSLKD